MPKYFNDSNDNLQNSFKRNWVEIYDLRIRSILSSLCDFCHASIKVLGNLLALDNAIVSKNVRTAAQSDLCVSLIFKNCL